MESEIDSQATLAKPTDETRTPSADSISAASPAAPADETRSPQPAAPDPRVGKKWTQEQKDRMSRLRLAQERDPKRRRAKKIQKERERDRRDPLTPSQRRRQIRALRKAATQRKRMESREKEQPELPQQPTDEHNPAGTALTWRRQYQLLPEAVRHELEAFRAQVIADLGGDKEMTAIKKQYVERLAQVDTVLNLLIIDLNNRGILTVKGKVRSTMAALAQMLDRYDKLAQRLGLERQARRVPLSIADVLNAPDDAPIDTTAHEPGEVDE